MQMLIVSEFQIQAKLKNVASVKILRRKQMRKQLIMGLCCVTLSSYQERTH